MKKSPAPTFRAATSPTSRAARAPRSASDKLRLAFIGAGEIAGVQLKELAKMPDVQIVALADIKPTPMTKHAETYKIPANCCFDNYQDMLARIKPDAVSVCTSNGAHAPAAIAAAQAGAHVIVEKPMAMNAGEAQAMIDAAGKAGTKLVIGFQMRYSPKAQFIKHAVDAGQLGTVLYARVQALRRRGIPNWGVFVQKDLQGGGPLIDIGVHMLEVTHYLMGAPQPVAASGKTFTYLGNQPCADIHCMWPNWDYKKHSIEDLAVGQIRFANGAILTLESSFIAHIHDNIANVTLMGDKGGAQFDPPTIFHDSAGFMVDKTPGYLANGEFPALFHSKLRNFVDHVLHDKPTMAPAQDGLMVQKMLDAIYQSADAGGKEVAIR